jgi:hypothetical protein
VPVFQPQILKFVFIQIHNSVSRTSAIKINDKTFADVVFSDDLLTDNFCNWILEEMYTGGEMKTYSAKFLSDKFNIPADQISTVAEALTIKEFIQTTTDQKNQLLFHLTWQGKSFMKEKLENINDGFFPLYTAHKKKPANPYLIAGIIIAVIAIAWIVVSKVL